jgi:peptide/nickel transport system permease protein
MGYYILRRILATIPVVVFVMVFIFSLLYITPGDPAAILAGDQATQEEIQSIRNELGLDRSFPVRFIGHTVFCRVILVPRSSPSFRSPK